MRRRLSTITALLMGALLAAAALVFALFRAK